MPQATSGEGTPAAKAQGKSKSKKQKAEAQPQSESQSAVAGSSTTGVPPGPDAGGQVPGEVGAAGVSAGTLDLAAMLEEARKTVNGPA